MHCIAGFVSRHGELVTGRLPGGSWEDSITFSELKIWRSCTPPYDLILGGPGGGFCGPGAGFGGPGGGFFSLSSSSCFATTSTTTKTTPRTTKNTTRTTKTTTRGFLSDHIRLYNLPYIRKIRPPKKTL